ncbi:unnamed protein product, partial [Rotaria sp. Silwood1]
YRPGKFKKNNELKDLYENGLCGKFKLSPPLFKKFYINRPTPIDILYDLIDYALHIKNYTIDTEDQLNKPPKPFDSALIQIQCIYEKDPSIILLIEAFHLPPEDSFTFNKIKQLCKFILSPKHIFYCWGDPKEELKDIIRFKLFNNNDVDQIEPKNIQDQFRDWFNRTYPQSIHIKDGANDQYSLQSAIYITFNEWLDKRMTLGNWGCGIDLSLQIYLSMNDYDVIKNQQIYGEKQIRQLMETYAMNDCFSITKINELLNDNNTVESVHVLDERTAVNDIIELYEPDSNIVLSVHEQTNILDDLEAISEEDEQHSIQNSILTHKEL